MTKYKVIFIALIAIIIATGAYILLPKSSKKLGSQTPSVSPTSAISQQTTLRGSRVCLPHKDQSGAQTMECAYGLKMTDGSYYALDMLALLEKGMDMGSQTEVEVTGLLVPIEMISTDVWQKYDIKGIVKVEKMVSI